MSAARRQEAVDFVLEAAASLGESAAAAETHPSRFAL
jgi:hypothetical protein